MGERYTVKDARSSFDGLMQVLNKRHTQYDHTPADIGSWHLDYNASYGGAVINVVLNEHYGVKVLGSRMKAYEFCQAIKLYYEIRNNS